MDPDALLARIHELCDTLKGAQNIAEMQDDLVSLMHEVNDLDEWLTKGGFPPAKFQN